MQAKIAIDKDGKITHLRVLLLAHANAADWKEINEGNVCELKEMALQTDYLLRPTRSGLQCCLCNSRLLKWLTGRLA